MLNWLGKVFARDRGRAEHISERPEPRTPATEFEPDSYPGACAICGVEQTFVRKARAIRETYHCASCRASLRERSQAQEIVTIFGNPGVRTFTELARDPGFRGLSIYEPGTSGPLRRFLRDIPGYVQSDYCPPGEDGKGAGQVRHEDLHALSFPDASFDLVISSDIFEHVRKPMVAFSEIHRVLKNGGWHVFTVPMQVPIAARSVARVDTSGDTDVHLLPPRYHGDGKGGKSLVYNDFGADLIPQLAAIGLPTQLRFPTTASAIANHAPTLVSRRSDT